MNERHIYEHAAPDDAGLPAGNGAAGAAPAADTSQANGAGPDGGQPAAGSAGETPAAQHSQSGNGETPAPGVSEARASADWKAVLGEDVRSSPSLKDISSVEDLASQFVNAQGLIGNSLRIPSEHASAEDKQAFRDTLRQKVPGLVEMSNDPEAFTAAMRNFGAPEDASGYRLPEGDGVPVEGFNEWAHEANMTQAQFDVVSQRYTEAQQQKAERTATKHQSDMELLNREWGYAANERSQQALDTARRTGAPEQFIEAMQANRVPADWVKYMAALGDRFGGESDVGQDRREGEREMTPAEAQSQHDEIMRNKEHPYWTSPPGSPEGERIRTMVMKLKERAMGPGSKTIAATFGGYSE